MGEEIQDRYFAALISCVELRKGISDVFFVETLDTKLRSLMISHGSTEPQQVVSDINLLLEFITQLQHLQMVEAVSSAECIEKLLRLKITIIQNKKEAPRVKKTLAKPTAVDNVPHVVSPPKDRFPQRTHKANQVREEILNFVRRKERARTKEILGQFNALSPRTIKRSLKELVDQGLLEKQVQGNSTHYFAI